tara:strand:- start:7 stop:450 length:444 start_codon:yes stop_codon:yes gene_type:complete
MNDRFAPPLPSVPGGIQWRDLATAPRDGTIIAVRFYPWDEASSQPSYQVAHWLRGEFRTPLQIDSIAYADAWVPVDELTRVLEEDQVKEGKQITTGSVVSLRGDGRKMTVFRQSTNKTGDWWHCVWFCERGLFHSEEFPAGALIVFK